MMVHASEISNHSCQSIRIIAKMRVDNVHKNEKTCVIQNKNWDDYFCSTERVSDDFMVERCQMPQSERESFDLWQF